MKTRYKTLLFTAILALIILAIFVMLLTSKNHMSTVTIGAIIPLSGPGSFLGQQFQKGMLLATQEINANDDVLHVIYEDSKADPKEGISAYKKIMTTSKPELFLSAFSGVSQALIPLIEEDRVPLMMGIVSGSNYAKKSDLAFRYFTNADIEAPIMANYAMTKEHITRFSVLYIADEYGNDYYTKFKEVVEMNGGQIISSESFMRSDSDFKTQLLKIKSSDSKGLYIIGYDDHTLAILKQAKELHLPQTLMTNWIMASPNNIEAAKDTVDEVLLTTPLYYTNTNAKKRSFEDSFSKMFETKPDAYAALGYDTMYIINNALKHLKDLAELQNALKETHLETLMGTVTSNEEGEMKFPLYPAKIENEKVIIFE